MCLVIPRGGGLLMKVELLALTNTNSGSNRYGRETLHMSAMSEELLEKVLFIPLFSLV